MEIEKEQVEIIYMYYKIVVNSGFKNENHDANGKEDELKKRFTDYLMAVILSP